MQRQENVYQHMGIKSISEPLMFPRVKCVLNILSGLEEYIMEYTGHAFGICVFFFPPLNLNHATHRADVLL